MQDKRMDLLERMGQDFEREGLPRIAGKVIGAVLLRREALSLDELAAGLGVSKASASTNARLLERLGVLERVTRPGDRRDYYTVSPDLDVRLLEMALARLRQGRAMLERVLESGEAADPVVRGRLERCRALFGRVLEQVERVGMERGARPVQDDGSWRDAAA
ncbi:MAG TPA: MarR family transcriptional regulator [Longimicrobiales bacterium]|nr:MarR family transcriptional regulator [Longimicrobiales bacterium]